MISVVMPAYNAERYIIEAIESILAQTHEDFEFVMVDDGSTDGTLDIMMDYAARDDRIRVLRQDNKGNPTALNRLMEEARTDWIANMDADDIVLPHRLETQLEAVRSNPHVVAWGSTVLHVNSRGKVLSTGTCGPTSEQEFHAKRAAGELTLLYHPTALMRRSAMIAAGGYDARYMACSDLDMFDRLGDQGPIVELPEPLAMYRVHSGQTSMVYFSNQRAIIRFVAARARARAMGAETLTYEAFHEAVESLPALTRLGRRMDDASRYWYRLGGLHYGEGRFAAAAIRFAFAVGLRPNYALPRIWHQLLSPRARRAVREGGCDAANEPERTAS